MYILSPSASFTHGNTNGKFLQFERGTISYVITSTLTRPTTISPTMSCHRRITVLENLDIAPFPPPKPRVVSLEAVSKKPKAILKQKNPSADQVQDSTLLEASLNGLSANDQRPPLSPAPSEISGSSRVSTSSQSFQIPGDPKSTRTGSVRSSGARSTTASLPEKTITATAELQRAGGLPGDTIPIKITINHNRKVRSPHGIIITLYRQGRIDVHPAIPVGPPGPDGKQNYEDYLPKSRTGLSGLSFGTSRSSSVFRKDLSQTFAPLIVDPVTMSATVKTSIRIPEDAFPTIGRVPGGMISFRYYVEVVVDLRGKLAAQDRFLPRLNMVSGGSNFSSSGQVFTVADKAGNSITSNWAGNILDTDQIRREKGVVAIVFEVVVGTRDSSRRPRQTTEENASLADHSAAFHSTSFDGADRYSDGHIDIGEEQYAAEGYYPNADYYYDHEEEYWDEYPTTGGQPYQSLGEVFPPPQPEEPVDEKTRLRREEEMLLPSRPPGQDEAGPSTVVATAPTAPDLPDDDPYPYNPPNSGNDAPSSAPLSSALSVETIVPGPSSAGPSEPPPARGEVQSHGDDKQELERQRLMMEASAPDPAPCGSTPAANAVPSAPVLDEEDQIISLDGGGDEALPRYQR